jgi:hypothetical protein
MFILNIPSVLLGLILPGRIIKKDDFDPARFEAIGFGPGEGRLEISPGSGNRWGR